MRRVPTITALLASLALAAGGCARPSPGSRPVIRAAEARAAAIADGTADGPNAGDLLLVLYAGVAGRTATQAGAGETGGIGQGRQALVTGEPAPGPLSAAAAQGGLSSGTSPDPAPDIGGGGDSGTSRSSGTTDCSPGYVKQDGHCVAARPSPIVFIRQVSPDPAPEQKR